MWDWQNDRWLNPKQGLSRTHMKMIVGDVNFIWEWGGGGWGRKGEGEQEWERVTCLLSPNQLLTD